MHQLAFPSSVSNEFGLDLFQRLRKLRLQKIVANSANGFLSPPAIEFLGAMVPKVNSTLYAASHDAVVHKLKKMLRLLQHGHCCSTKFCLCSARRRRSVVFINFYLWLNIKNGALKSFKEQCVDKGAITAVGAKITSRVEEAR